MKNYMITVAYDGTRYKGWQVQKSTDDTIQGKLQKVLESMCGHPVEVIGSGRTDAGVHARNQVANFHIDDNFTENELMDGLNHYLPGDIAVTSIAQVDDRFHSRYNAKKKTYIYRINTSEQSNVFEHRFVYEYGAPLDEKLMVRGAKLLLGTHDFKSFCGNKKMKKSTVRTIYDINIEKIGSEIRIKYTGDGFLQNMIRILTGTLIEIGRGDRAYESVTDILNAMDREVAGYTAPPQGLILEEVEY